IDPSISKKIKDYLELRNRSQPLKENTCGCMFKNFKDLSTTCLAGQFLDILGMKGFTVNGIRVSPQHANFMENVGNASHEEVVAIVKLVQAELKLQFGIEFETEVKMPKS
ncbi:MAG: UDP-N-acetylenolpyruvoylglucosamine reductase, partial [Halobacteriovoraceae bacterium]|nr:UDP-N-acetylenolpyruvoylglucosamine reductase [Halobacteriovoraceae bacterium]